MVVIPDRYLNDKQGRILRYKRVPNFKKCFTHISENSSIVLFGTSNIRRTQYWGISGLRFEVVLLRIRFVVYQLLILSLNQLPIFLGILIILFEFWHILYNLYYSLGYRYNQSWLLLVSKLNIGTSIIIICSLSLILSLTQKSSKFEIQAVSQYMQYVGLAAFLICVFIEILVLVLTMVVGIYFMIKNCKKKKIKREIFVYYWKKIEEKTKNEDDENTLLSPYFNNRDGNLSIQQQKGHKNGLKNRLSKSKNPVKKSQKFGFDDYLTFNRLSNKKPIVLDGESSSTPIIESEDEKEPRDQTQRNKKKQGNSVGGVVNVKDIKVIFTEEEVNLWFEYHPKWRLCRCLIPFDARIKGFSMHKKTQLKNLRRASNQEIGIGRMNNDFRFVLNIAQYGEERANAIEDALVEERMAHRLKKEYGVLDFDFN